MTSRAAKHRGPSLFLLVCLVLLGYEAYAAFFKRSGVPANRRASARYQVGEIAGETRVSQTLTLWAAGFERVVLFPAPFSDVARGEVVFELKELVQLNAMQSTERPIFRLVRPAEEVLQASAFALDLPPIEGSRGRRYRIEVRMPTARAGEGITLLATKEEGYPPGALFVNGREQWGDLVFETSATGATAFGQLELTLADQPPLLRSRWGLGLVLLVYNLALVVFVRQLLFSGLCVE